MKITRVHSRLVDLPLPAPFHPAWARGRNQTNDPAGAGLGGNRCRASSATPRRMLGWKQPLPSNALCRHI